MRDRREIKVAMAIMLVLVLGLVILLRHQNVHDASTSAQNGPPPLAATKSPPQSNKIASSITTTQQKLGRAVENKNVPIDFWGKVIDQDGNPLAEVKVAATARSWKSGENAFGSSYPTVNAISEPDGRFKIHGMSGDVLTIKQIVKDGYAPEPNALRSYGYNISQNITPTETNPIVFRLWKENSKNEPLISGEKFWAIIPDGRVYTVDLVNGTKVESESAHGDFRIWVKRPMDAKFGDRYSWSYQIEALDGGISEEPDRLAPMFGAPTEGYERRYRFERSADDRSWGYTSRPHLYIKTRGLYGRLMFDIYAYYDKNANDGTLGLKYAINPSGSRILR